MEPLEYPGDARFREILLQAGNPFTVEEARAAIAGAILAVDMIPPSGVLEILSENEEGEERELKLENAEEFFAVFMGLWNELAIHQNPNHPFRFSPLPKNIGVKNKEAVLKAASIRAMEVSMFLSVLDAGNTPFGYEDGSDVNDDEPEHLPQSLEIGLDLLQSFIDNPQAWQSDTGYMVVTLTEEMDRQMLKLYPKFIAETKALR